MQLDTNQAPLIAGLAEAEARVAKSVAVMQAMLDKLHANVDSHIGTMDALARKTAEVGTGPGSATPAPGQTHQGTDSGVWGIRGPQHPGSMTNPIVTVVEAAKFTPLGSYAASVGESNVADTQRGVDQSGLADAANMSALTAAVQALADNANPASQMATAGLNGMGEPQNATRTVVALDKDDQEALRSMAAALERMESRGAGPSGSSEHTVIVDHDTRTVQTQGPARTIIAGTEGSGARQTVLSGPAGGNTFRIDGGQYAGLISAIVESGKGSTNVFLNGGGGGTSVPVAASTGGGGGGNGLGLLGLLGFGRGGGIPGTRIGGLAGFAGAGTAAGFAGFGLEHYLFTALGDRRVGSWRCCWWCGPAWAQARWARFGVGGGSDIGVLKSTIGDTQTLSQGITALSTATATFGKNSQQAQQAAKSLQATIQSLGNTAGVAAEVGLAKAGQAADHFFDLQTSGARVQAVNILMQAVHAAYTFIPLIAQSALRNLTIINQAIKPLFAWLEGPQGVQIWNDLENLFATHLPIAMHAFTQGVELVLRVVDIAAQDTGGLVNFLDKLFTRLNSESNMGTLSLEVKQTG